MFSSIGIPEILIILTAVLLLFGGRKIPQLARDLGTGIREFKRSLTSARDGFELEEGGQVIEGERSIARAPARKKQGKAKKKKKAKRSS